MAYLANKSFESGVTHFDPDYIPTGTEPIGTTYYDATNRTISTVLENGTIMQHGQEMPVPAYNNTGVAIANGIPVYVNGRHGHEPTIALAISDSDTTCMVFGLTTSAFGATGDDKKGYVTTEGLVRGIKTNYTGDGDWGTDWAEGDKLYVSKTVAGQLTNIEPAIPHHADVIGTVAVVGSVGIGAIDVHILRHKSIEEMSDVNGTDPVDGSILSYHATEKYFDFDKNINDYIEKAEAPATATSNGTAGQIAYDSDYIYVCVATNTWRRALIETWS